MIFECHSTDNINGNVGAAEQNYCINLITAIQKEFTSQWWWCDIFFVNKKNLKFKADNRWKFLTNFYLGTM